MTFCRYEEYEDLGGSLFPNKPRHWRLTQLKYLGTFLNGFPFKPSDWGDLGKPILRISQLTSQVESNYYSGPQTPRMIQVETGDLLFSWSGTIDAFIWEGRSALLNQHIFKVIPAEGVDITYLYYLLKYVAPKLTDVDAHGSAMRHIKMENLGEAVALPALSEQLLIADFLVDQLSQLDKLIREYEHLISLLSEKCKSSISHAVTNGLDPDVLMRDSGIDWVGEVPAHWTVKRLRFLFKQQKRQCYPQKAVLSVYRDYGVILKSSRDDNMNKTPDNLSAYQLVNPNDLVVNKMKAWQGSLGISQFEGITSPDYVVFTPHHEESSIFLHLLLRSQSMVSIYRSISNGIRPAQWRLEPDAFLDLPVVLPPTQEQTDLVSFIRDQTLSFERLISEAKNAVGLLEERRNALISAAVTGKIDVRNYTPKETA